MRHLTEISDFSVEEISQLISVSRDIMTTPQSYIDAMRGKVMATLFYEPSTRTKSSFEAAMQRLRVSDRICRSREHICGKG